MLLSFLFGTSGFFVCRNDSARALNALSECSVQYVSLEANDEGISFRVPLFRKKTVCESFAERCIEYNATGDNGVPRIVFKYRRRWGIALGLLIFIFLNVLSSKIVWSVEVSGNPNVPDSVIISRLNELGLGVGDYFDNIDFDTLHNEFLIKNHDIAWISVNMEGTHAHVEVRETMSGAGESDSGFYNVIADEDGQIEQVSSFEGKPVVTPGDIVRKGELLITGIITYKDTKLRYESAAGEIYAKVRRTFCAEIPSEIEQKVYTGKESVKKKLTFFDFNINLFLNSGIQYEFYDTIMMDKQICLFNSVEVPVWVKSSVCREYETVTKTLTEKEAKALCEAEYTRLLRDTLGSGMLLEKTTERSYGEDGVYRINCSLYCIDNIAKKAQIGINESESEIGDGRENSNNSDQ